MATLSTTPRRSLIAAVARWWHNWNGNRASSAELDNLGPDELKHIARDAGVDTQELRALAGKWPESADLLAQRMKVLHLDPEEIAHTQPGVSNDLKKLCSLCDAKRRCEYDLTRGAVNPIWRHYYPNATTLMALIAGRSVRSKNVEGAGK